MNMYTPPNQTITGQHVGHSSSAPKGTPADGIGYGGGHDGKADPPNNNVLRANRGLSGNPPAATDGRLGSGSVPVEPFGPSGQPRAGTGLRGDDAGQFKRGR
jgi:hypothetical protein